MTTGYDIDRLGNNMNKRARIPIIKKREIPAPRNACNPLQIPNQQ